MAHSTNQRIRLKAYEIWLREGCPEGSEARHWEMARRFIAGEDAKATLTSRFFDVHDMNAGSSVQDELPAGAKASRARKSKAH